MILSEFPAAGYTIVLFNLLKIACLLVSCPNPLTLKEVMFIGVFVWAVDVMTVGWLVGVGSILKKRILRIREEMIDCILFMFLWRPCGLSLE